MGLDRGQREVLQLLSMNWYHLAMIKLTVIISIKDGLDPIETSPNETNDEIDPDLSF